MTDTATDREAPKRLRAADVIESYRETITNLTTRKTTGDASVDINRNAKGETQFAVKLGAPLGVDEEEFTAHVRFVLDQATEAYLALARRFPSASGKVTNDGEPVES